MGLNIRTDICKPGLPFSSFVFEDKVVTFITAGSLLIDLFFCKGSDGNYILCFWWQSLKLVVRVFCIVSLRRPIIYNVTFILNLILLKQSLFIKLAPDVQLQTMKSMETSSSRIKGELSTSGAKRNRKA